MTTAPLSGLEPRAFWEHFEALTRIARPSRHEEPAIEHVRAWAAAQGLEVVQDAGRNIVIRVPATADREGAPLVTLQGHLDMVCERDPASPNDPAEGRISLVRDGEWLKADGTTLGADDGVAIAAMMALADDTTLPHGPLELLMTVAEEVGLEGANALDPALVTGSILVNLDSEEDGKLTVGCAGSTDTWVYVDAPRAEPDEGAVTLAVTVSGGLGGHSGMNITLGRSNAVKVLGRALRDAHGTVPFRLVTLAGGKSRNAIPRDASAVVSVAADRENELPDGSGVGGRRHPRRVLDDRSRRHRHRDATQRTRPHPGRRRGRLRCSTRSPSSPPARSRSAPTSTTSSRRAPRSARLPRTETG